MVDLHQGKVMIGHKLRRLRTTLKLSQTAMATELGISDITRRDRRDRHLAEAEAIRLLGWVARATTATAP